MERGIKIMVALLVSISVFTSSVDFDFLLRFIVLVTIGILAYHSFVLKKLVQMGIFILIIALFQLSVLIPIVDPWWLILKVLIALYLLLSVLFELFSKKNDLE